MLGTMIFVAVEKFCLPEERGFVVAMPLHDAEIELQHRAFRLLDQ
jgi:hypothetical protein